MNKHGNLKCVACGSEKLELIVAYDGADWCSVHGEGSGFDYCIDLVCFECGRAYPVARAKKQYEVCDIRELEQKI